VVIESLTPQVDAGRFPAKRVLGDAVVVEADVFTHGHDLVRASLRWRCAGEAEFAEVPMVRLGNDRWRAHFVPVQLGPFEYSVEGWRDEPGTWLRDLARRASAGPVPAVEWQVGADLLNRAAALATADPLAAQRLAAAATAMSASLTPDDSRLQSWTDEAGWYLGRNQGTVSNLLSVSVDPPRARFSTWYEIFPRSLGEAGEGGFAALEKEIPRIAAMGFDVLYLPPIHPIGRSHRKGAGNTAQAAPDDPGSPWAIGSAEGGHKSIDPELGTLADFRHLLTSARGAGLEVALDLAFQCSPDHPYVTAHPQWFRHLPDGAIRHAENPPKTYEDIIPFDFDTVERVALWAELKDICDYWIGQGVRIFRVDNPHTKPFDFWEWLLAALKEATPDLIFLSEAFTRPRVMERLAKVGFTQSYTYFAWRNRPYELRQYLTELTQGPSREYLRPNLWPNTPDILTEYLQTGGRAGFVVRLVLAATLAASYGVYGPPYEAQEGRAAGPGSEEYFESEKYQLRRWPRGQEMADLMALLNRVRREHLALQSDSSLHFHEVDNPELLVYSKTSEEGGDVMLMVVNTDVANPQAGWTDLDLSELGLDEGAKFVVHDLLTQSRYHWQGRRNFVRLEPARLPAHVFLVAFSAER